MVLERKSIAWTTKNHKDEPAIEPIPTLPTRPIDAPSPSSTNISNAGGLGAGGSALLPWIHSRWMISAGSSNTINPWDLKG